MTKPQTGQGTCGSQLPQEKGLEEVQLKPTQPTPTQQPLEPAATIPQMPTCGEKAIRHIKDRQSQIFEISHPFITTFSVNLYKEYTSLKSRELEELPRFEVMSWQPS